MMLNIEAREGMENEKRKVREREKNKGGSYTFIT